MATPDSKREKATAQRRQLILEAAVTGFVENGYHQTGVREIAKRAGISLGNLYNHFSGKHEVLAEIAELEREELQPFLVLLAQDGPADQVLDRFLSAYLDYLASPEIVILTLEITCEAMRKPDIAELFTGSRNELVVALSRLIERGISEGRLRSVLDIEETAHLVIEAIEGSSYRIAVGGASTKRIAANLKHFVFAALVVD